jgi:CubicO group peptidase (beta-lactamase class C family)
MKFSRVAGPVAALTITVCALARGADLVSTGPDLAAAERRPVTLENFILPPYNRWALQHIRELQPTAEVYPGSGQPAALEEAPVDLDDLRFALAGGKTIDLKSWMAQSYTDSFLVLHQGKLVYERYFTGMQPYTQHQMFSATKSVIATLALTLIQEGKIDPQAKITRYLPELQDSAFAGATVQQVLDMTTSIEFSEDYEDPAADIWQYGYVFAIGGKAPADYAGAKTIYDYLPTLKAGDGRHGRAFHYVTPNTDVIGWLVSRVSGQSVQDLLSERIWQRLGVERGGYFWLDAGGTAMAGGGLSIAARDAARFGQMILQGGAYNGQQIIPPEVARRILQPGNRAVFNVNYQDPWYEHIGYAYHDMWWTFNNEHKAVSAIGVHGQFIYLDPVADMVIVKQSSHPDAEGESNEFDGPQIWHQIARHLIASSTTPKPGT